ncbi:hypothetical protein Y1Q_0013606 [Alligator mississippiensis]|uniref:Uncharacterized protein n=1 Tax=Alligator mississippiensis TaxID=8496 RepID=A0A151P3F5_ALLMI|nr:hypothetical protein Y1Q_0013606 [Alligator mississippiensis]
MVELAPPVLEVKVKENSMTVNAIFPLAYCLKSEFQSLQYDLEFLEARSNDTASVCAVESQRPLPSVLEKKPNEEELESQKRRNNPTARNNISPAASLFSLLEEEDDHSFTPYIEMAVPKERPRLLSVWHESERVGVLL